MTSDSSDEENLDLLKEAQDAQFINDSMFSGSAERPPDSQVKRSLPSLRRSRDEDEQFNFLKVTPEFRSYVAKQLTRILDSKLDKKFANFEVPEVPRKKRKKEGIKLLSDSKHFLKITENGIAKDTESETHNCKAKLVKNSKENNKEITEELLKEVAVSAEDILSKKEVKSWSNRSKAPVFRYKKSKNGQLKLVESEVN